LHMILRAARSNSAGFFFVFAAVILV